MTHHRLPPDLEIVGREPDWLIRTQAEFSFDDCDNEAAPVRKCLEHADLVGVFGQPELRFECLPRNRTGDLAARHGQAARNFVLVCGRVDCSLLETVYPGTAASGAVPSLDTTVCIIVRTCLATRTE